MKARNIKHQTARFIKASGGQFLRLSQDLIRVPKSQKYPYRFKMRLTDGNLIVRPVKKGIGWPDTRFSPLQKSVYIRVQTFFRIMGAPVPLGREFPAFRRKPGGEIVVQMK